METYRRMEFATVHCCGAQFHIKIINYITAMFREIDPTELFGTIMRIITTIKIITVFFLLQILILQNQF